MADINLLDVKPHQVNRDLRGYSVFFYGDPKSGKTTIATKFPNHLLLAFEKGYSAIPGAMAQPINSWSEFKKVLRQLKDPEVQKKFETIIVDTADVAYDYCENYICSNNNVDAINDIGYGKGYTLVGKEFDECLRQIVKLNYGLVLISHASDKTFTDESGREYNQIVPTLGARPRNIVSRLCDIIGYSRAVQDATGAITTKLFMRGTPRYMAGSRFKYTPDYIDFDYGSLVKAIGEAIDKQMEEDGEKYFIDSNKNIYASTVSVELDFDDLMSQFTDIIANIPGSSDPKGETEDGIKFREYWQPRISQIIEKYLGKNRKIKDASRDQAEAIDLIVTDLKELIKA